MLQKKLIKYKDSDSSLGGDARGVINLIIDRHKKSTIPRLIANSFIGGNEQKNNDILGVNMEILQRYHEYLCGVYTNKTTIKNNYNAVKRFYKDVKGDCSKENVLKWRRHINDTKAHNTINVYTDAVNRFLLWMGLTEKEKPWMKTIGSIETDQVTLSDHEITLLIENSENDPETHLMVLLLFHALRPNDLINIKISNLKDDTLYLKKTKTGNNHTILTKQILNAWKKYLQVRPKPKQGYEDYLFICKQPSSNGKPYTTILPIEKRVTKIAKNSEIKEHVTPLTLRRTCGTLGQNNLSEYYLGSPRNTQKLFRHASIEQTLKYDHSTDNDLRKSLQERENNLTETGKDLKKTGKDLTDEGGTYPLYNYVFPTETNENLDDNNSFSFSFSFSFFDDYLKLPFMDFHRRRFF